MVEVYREFCGMFALLHCVYRSASGQSVFPVNADHADEQYNLVGAMSLVLELPCGRSKSIPPIDQDEGARLCNAPTRRPWQQLKSLSRHALQLQLQPHNLVSLVLLLLILFYVVSAFSL